MPARTLTLSRPPSARLRAFLRDAGLDYASLLAYNAAMAKDRDKRLERLLEDADLLAEVRRRLASEGGRARMERLTKFERTELARKAARARWGERKRKGAR